MRVHAAGLTNALITAVRGPSVYGIAGKGGRLREVGIFNVTTTAFAVALVRASAAGTLGTALTEVSGDSVLQTNAPQLVASNTHTADATVGAAIRRATIGAAAGAGVTWTFGEEGLIIPAGTANGIVIILPTGVAQNFDFHFEWDE